MKIAKGMLIAGSIVLAAATVFSWLTVGWKPLHPVNLAMITFNIIWLFSLRKRA